MFKEYESDKVNNSKRTKILLNLLLWRWSKHYSLFNTTNNEFFEKKKGSSVVLNNKLFTIFKVTNTVKTFFHVIYLVW